jgi:hypothetical protein
MRKILLTLVLLFAVYPALLAQMQRSILKIRVNDQAPILVKIDARYFNEEARVITVDNITPGRHRLKVFLATPQGFSSRALLYDGYVRIDPGTVNNVLVDRIRRTIRIQTRMIDESGETDVHYPNDPIDRSKYPRHNNEQTKDRGRYDEWPLSTGEMNDLRSRVEGRITDTDKLKLLKTALAERRYTTDQVRTMMSWLNFESSKLDLGKWAYANVTDRRNYWKLESEFTFDSTKEEFGEFVNANK